jgi:hypothetical protein
MESVEKAKIAKHLIDTVFTQQIAQRLDVFLEEYRKVIVFKNEYKNITGYDIAVPEPIVLDISVPAQKLLESLVILMVN